MTALLLGGGGLAATVLATPLLASLAVLGSTTPAPPCGPESSIACTTATGVEAGPAPRGPRDALVAALSMVGTRTGWHRLCDRLVCRAYGYANSGYLTAAAHWAAMSRDGLVHPGDRCPPPGSFAFWDTGAGQPGHVALVISRAGCNPHLITVVSNDVLDRATGSYGGIYHVTLARLEAGFVDRARYLGWSVPVCAGLPLPTDSTARPGADRGPVR